jgi:hypothetical protein
MNKDDKFKFITKSLAKCIDMLWNGEEDNSVEKCVECQITFEMWET